MSHTEQPVSLADVIVGARVFVVRQRQDGHERMSWEEVSRRSHKYGYFTQYGREHKFALSDGCSCHGDCNARANGYGFDVYTSDLEYFRVQHAAVERQRLHDRLIGPCGRISDAVSDSAVAQIHAILDAIGGEREMATKGPRNSPAPSGDIPGQRRLWADGDEAPPTLACSLIVASSARETRLIDWSELGSEIEEEVVEVGPDFSDLGWSLPPSCGLWRFDGSLLLRGEDGSLLRGEWTLLLDWSSFGHIGGAL
jgi:hypothetical protein